MSNFVSNKIICSKEFLENYFIDFYPFGKNEHKLKKPYITFNKLFGVQSLNEYNKKYGQCVYYGYSFNYKDIGDNLVEIKFQTRCLYPICAIKKAIELDHNIIWYALEENIIYISKFEWAKEKVIEKTLYIETDNFNNWYDLNVLNGNNYDDLESYDDDVWYFNDYSEDEWKIWETDDLIKRYNKHYPAKEFYDEMCKEKN